MSSETGRSTGTTFEQIFRSDAARRDNFLARLFGIFSEDVVRHWSRNDAAKYEDLGRPTIFTPEGRWHTLDFTFRDRETGQIYASEMKCELAFEGYRYLRLTGCDQLDHHQGAAFRRFLELAHRNHGLIVKVGGRPLDIDGAILVWGAMTADGAEAVKSDLAIFDVLSIEDMVRDLHAWEDSAWRERVAEIQRWAGELFSYLAGPRSE